MATSSMPIDPTGILVTEPVALADWLMVAPVVLPLGFGALLVMLRKRTGCHAPIAITALALTFLAELALLARVVSEGTRVMTMGSWLPPFGISFTVDVLGATFAAASGLVALICAVHATRDIDSIGRRYGFYPFLLLMMAGVAGTFVTGDLFNLYVWFEILLISSFGLLVLGSTRLQLDGTLKYAFLNLAATMLFLITTGMLYGVFGTLNMADIARKAAGLKEIGPLITLATMFLLAFGAKAAAFPVNFWLPASYHTPQVVTSALFAGLLTKVGVYALIRILVMLLPAEREVLAELIGWIAIATMLAGILGALAESDIRRMMGFVVISGIGTMLAGLALANPLALSGAIFYAIHSMLVMTGLYLLSGMMRERTGTFSLHATAGLYRRSPLLAGAALLLVFAASGLPPLSGLWPKVMLVKASFDAGAWALGLAILIASLLTMLALGRLFLLAFWRDEAPEPDEGDAIVMPAVGGLGHAVLAAVLLPALILGIYPDPMLRLTDAAAAGLLDAGRYIGTVFPGVTP